MRRGIGQLTLLLAAALLTGGCAQKSQSLYNYGTYSERYYAYKKDATDESMFALQQSIEKAIENAGDSRSGRVPPGMYANLGYLYLKSGNGKEAITNFEREKAIYPESAHFMERMIRKVEAAEGKEVK